MILNILLYWINRSHSQSYCVVYTDKYIWLYIIIIIIIHIHLSYILYTDVVSKEENQTIDI